MAKQYLLANCIVDDACNNEWGVENITLEAKNVLCSCPSMCMKASFST